MINNNGIWYDLKKKRIRLKRIWKAFEIER